MEQIERCYYCGSPARQHFRREETEPGRPDQIWVCSVRIIGDGPSRIALPWARCRRWAEADGYRRDRKRES